MGNLLGSPVTEKETHVGCTTDGTIQFGISSMQGWRIHMEDAHIAETNLYAIVSNNSSNDSSSSSSGGGVDGIHPSSSSSFQQQQQQRKVPLEGHALFAVFDGHGGSFAAEYAGANFCRVLSQQLGPYSTFCESRKSSVACTTTTNNKSQVEHVKYIRSGLQLLETALRNAFLVMDKEILLAVRDEPVAEANSPYHVGNAAATTSKPLPTPNSDEDSGTTAVVVMITPDWIVCANAGDSRAVCCKKPLLQPQQHQQQKSVVVPLSYDHKPDDEDEERRIRAAGGYVAAGRVDGDLAVSRGLGDYRFKHLSTVLNCEPTITTSTTKEDDDNHHIATRTAPYTTTSASLSAAGDQKVSPVPDIIVQNRSIEQDEFIIVACDGIWDVQTNYECVQMVADIFAEGEDDLGLVCEEMLDMCLSMGSKDNMTSLIIKFPAQIIGEKLDDNNKDGCIGGVMARRQKRNAVLEDPSRNSYSNTNSRHDNPADDDDDDDEDMSHPVGGLYF